MINLIGKMEVENQGMDAYLGLCLTHRTRPQQGAGCMARWKGCLAAYYKLNTLQIGGVILYGYGRMLRDK